MTLEEVRKEIDSIDSNMKPLFLNRMDCAKHVAEAKALSGADVFVPAREEEIINERTGDVDSDVKSEYEMFLRHLMSLSRHYQYGKLTAMQDKVISEALERNGLTEDTVHEQVTVQFTDSRDKSILHLILNMTNLNRILIDEMNVISKQNLQLVTMRLHGNLKQPDMRRLLCQIGKEAVKFEITELK